VLSRVNSINWSVISMKVGVFLPILGLNENGIEDMKLTEGN
jgi:hypothetical protein